MSSRVCYSVVVVLAGVAGSACATSGTLTRPLPFPASTAAVAPELETPDGSPAAGAALAIVDSALSLRGTAYHFGGSTPDSGFDCSGFVTYVFALHAIRVPRSVAEQFRVGTPVERDRLQRGDLVFFSTIGPGATHVGIVTNPGDAEFIHAPADGASVRVERFDAGYWRSRWMGARRLF